jgi:sugar phosphate isomerase/epimerase
MSHNITDFSKLCIHTITNKPWDIETCIRKYSEAGINGITVWRNVLENKNLVTVRQVLDDFDMNVISLARGGFFPATSKQKRSEAIDDNLWAIEQAAAIGAPSLVLVPGADCNQSLEASREQITEGIQQILPFAISCGIKLSIEPLHPMYAVDRSAINTLKQANDLAQQINNKSVGVAVDVYHLWWDENLEHEIKRCGESGFLFAFHVCDWNVPTTDFLNDRGLMGDGCIDIKKIRNWVEQAGFDGYNEVEVFSTKYWSLNQNEYLTKIKNAYMQNT